MTRTNTAPALDTHGTLSVEDAIELACGRIAPTWPLDRFIAVNPFWGFVEMPVEGASARLAALAGTRLLMPRSWYRDRWAEGALTEEHVQQAIEEKGAPRTVAQLRAALEVQDSPSSRRAFVTDVADAHRDTVHRGAWGDFVRHGISQTCASYFQELDAQPTASSGLYARWRRDALRDHGPHLLMGLGGYRTLVAALPLEPRDTIARALEALRVDPSEWEPYLEALLMDINGWAAFGAYRRWEARLAQRTDDHLVEVLAVRLAWEWMLYRAGGEDLERRFRAARAQWASTDAEARRAQEDLWLVHRALEIAYQQGLCRQLPEGLDAAPPASPALQVVFCIDVRSEVFRRALEGESTRIQTLGFAGFFGLPVEYQALASSAARPQLPGLLAPRLRVTDEGVPRSVEARRGDRLQLKDLWQRFKMGAASGFSFVEAMGVPYAFELAANTFALTRPYPHPEHVGLTTREDACRKPRLTSTVQGAPLSVEEKADLAAGILRAMSLTRAFAPVVVLMGHGSETVNNAHGAGLDCGACCGQTGEVNARAAAALLNDTQVREALEARGIHVPSSTVFVAGAHNTTTDDARLFDVDELPPNRQAQIAQARAWFEGAGEKARRERAPSLALEPGDGPALRDAVTSRARDWSQIRPEWGLANNAAFVVAPREHCRHMRLGGRAFLHEYRWNEDTDFRVLEQIMTAPVIVAHWINMQYFASTVDNARCGSGNKTLHNVVGGHLGVFEGNGGDLRIGLPLQSVHDGSRWMHTPLRLSVFIEAPSSAIERVLRKHDRVRDLVHNEWLYLFRMGANEGPVRAYRQGGWTAP